MMTSLKTLGLVFLGGALGSLARFAIGEMWLDEFWLLLTVNTLGSILIGCANALPRLHTEATRAFVSIGFAGGFTTMSGLAVFIVDAGQPWGALCIFLVGLLGYGLGSEAGRRWGGAR